METKGSVCVWGGWHHTGDSCSVPQDKEMFNSDLATQDIYSGLWCVTQGTHVEPQLHLPTLVMQLSHKSWDWCYKTLTLFFLFLLNCHYIGFICECLRKLRWNTCARTHTYRENVHLKSVQWIKICLLYGWDVSVCLRKLKERGPASDKQD